MRRRSTSVYCAIALSAVLALLASCSSALPPASKHWIATIKYSDGGIAPVHSSLMIDSRGKIVARLACNRRHFDVGEDLARSWSTRLERVVKGGSTWSRGALGEPAFVEISTPEGQASGTVWSGMDVHVASVLEEVDRALGAASAGRCGLDRLVPMAEMVRGE